MKVGKHDTFERLYMGKFRALTAQYGEFVEYERDRAARDIGIHLTIPKAAGGEIVSPALCWFQLKGIHASTLSLEQFESSENVEIRIGIQHLRFWYILPAPTYLVVYVEADDSFFVTDIKKYVADRFGDAILEEKRKSIAVFLSKESPLDEQAFALILRRHNLEAWQEKIHGDESFATVFFRDADLIYRISTAEERGVEIIFVLRKYGSKMRSEVHLLERQIGEHGEEIEIHEHWHYAMPDPELVFPYLALSPESEKDEDWDDYWDEDEISDWEPIVLSSGKVVEPEGVFELVEYRMKASLNDMGEAWLQTLEIMQAAGFIELDQNSKTLVSVAPWHARDV